jgi:hypothetical protein
MYKHHLTTHAHTSSHPTYIHVYTHTYQLIIHTNQLIIHTYTSFKWKIIRDTPDWLRTCRLWFWVHKSDTHPFVCTNVRIACTLYLQNYVWMLIEDEHALQVEPPAHSLDKVTLEHIHVNVIRTNICWNMYLAHVRASYDPGHNNVIYTNMGWGLKHVWSSPAFLRQSIVWVEICKHNAHKYGLINVLSSWQSTIRQQTR